MLKSAESSALFLGGAICYEVWSQTYVCFELSALCAIGTWRVPTLKLKTAPVERLVIFELEMKMIGNCFDPALLAIKRGFECGLLYFPGLGVFHNCVE